MNFLKNKFFIIAGFVVLALSVIVLNINTPQQPTPQPAPELPIPSPIPSVVYPTESVQYSDEYKRQQEEIIKREANLSQRETLVGQLREKLPYSRTNFFMTYTRSTNTFTVVIKKNKQTEGNSELDAFLLQNSIQSRSWIRDLVIRYE